MTARRGTHREADTKRGRDGSKQRAFARRRIVRRVAQLPAGSRFLYRVEHYSSLAAVSLTAIAALVGGVIVGAAMGFPSSWVTAFTVSTSGLTLLMVFAIQHTQAREQAATQRKLDELIRALPAADDAFMMLEEAAPEVLADADEGLRESSSGPPDAER